MIHPENLNNVEYYPFKNIKLIGSDWKNEYFIRFFGLLSKTEKA